MSSILKLKQLKDKMEECRYIMLL